ncbi:hypothetical protein Bbelb_225360 [Branchiostoma belcheri]|nr:hypothetical protein Bbelb_225360 [Branchiostoma belcheri]
MAEIQRRKAWSRSCVENCGNKSPEITASKVVFCEERICKVMRQLILFGGRRYDESRSPPRILMRRGEWRRTYFEKSGGEDGITVSAKGHYRCQKTLDTSTGVSDTHQPQYIHYMSQLPTNSSEVRYTCFPLRA